MTTFRNLNPCRYCRRVRMVDAFHVCKPCRDIIKDEARAEAEPMTPPPAKRAKESEA